jgi:hypothetical protein
MGPIGYYGSFFFVFLSLLIYVAFGVLVDTQGEI